MSTSTVNTIFANVIASVNDVLTTNIDEVVLIGLGLALIFFAVRVVKRALR
jgi:MFS superfamily sulfate permease-like transporter